MNATKSALRLLLALLGAYSPLWAEASPARIILLGDSTVITSYLPETQRHTEVLQKILDERYGPHVAKVDNWADNGEFIARFLLNGAYEKFRAAAEGADLFLIRFGINDQKRYTAVVFAQQVEKLLELLHADFPDAKFILETGVYVNPKHYTNDRNIVLNPYWDQIRRIAAEQKLPLCDVYQAMETATRAGNWDLRIRRTEPGAPNVLDNSQDHAHRGKDWFRNIHPNPEGVRVAAEAEAQLIFEEFPRQLPQGGSKTDRHAKSTAQYETFLGVTKATLRLRGTKEHDGLQTPLQR